jgi:hypothetical protein
MLQDQFSVHLKDENLIAVSRAGVELDFIQVTLLLVKYLTRASTSPSSNF